MLAATSKRRQIGVLLQQAQTEYQTALRTLQIQLASDSPIRSVSVFDRYDLPAFADSSEFLNNPQLAYLKQNTSTAEAGFKYQRAQLWPALNVGLGDQTVQGQPGFFLIKAGVSIPLFGWSDIARTKAAKIEVQETEMEFAGEYLNAQLQYQQLLADINKLGTSLDYYEQQGLNLANEQTSAAVISFRLGDIDHLAFIQNLNLATDIQLEYLSAQYQYNRNVIHLKRLSGELISETQNK